MACGTIPPIEMGFKTTIDPGMNGPHDVIHHCGRYIVTDTKYHRVISISTGDGSSKVLCKDREGLGPSSKKMKPYGIVALSNVIENFLFTDMNNRCVTQYNDGEVRVWNNPTSLEIGCPTGIAVDRRGEVYVADCKKKCIHIFDDGGNYARSFGDKDLIFPWFLNFNSKSCLYVADQVEGIKIFDENHEFKERLDVRMENKSWKCRGIAIDKYDNIFVTARSVSSFAMVSCEKVLVFDHNHQPIDSLGGFMQFHYVRGICFDYEKNLAVIVDGEWHRLQVYKLYDRSGDRSTAVVEEESVQLSITVSSQEDESPELSKETESEIAGDDDDSTGGADSLPSPIIEYYSDLSSSHDKS